jgi:hypothetical protein
MQATTEIKDDNEKITQAKAFSNISLRMILLQKIKYHVQLFATVSSY